MGGMSSKRLVWQVYHTNRSRYDTSSQDNHTHSKDKWCHNIHTLLKSIDMEDLWKRNTMEEKEAKEWRSTLREKIQAREEMQWKERMQQKPKLRTYRQLKTRLRFEDYLMTRDREAREVITRLRGGTNELRIERGRYAITNRDRPLEVHERRCLICMSEEIEDERHFMLNCSVYEDLRQKMFVTLERTLSKQQPSIDIQKARKEEEGERNCWRD